MEHTRRSERRVSTALPFILGSAAAVTRDVSASGIFAETDMQFPLGEPLTFCLPLDGRNGKLVLTGEAHVVRVEPRNSKVGIAVRITQSALQPA